MTWVLVLLVLSLLTPVYGQTLKIGMVIDSPQTDAYFAERDEDVLNGVYLCADWFNDVGGVDANGTHYSVEVLTRSLDDYINEMDAETRFRQATHDLIVLDGVDVVIGSVGDIRTYWGADETNDVDSNIPFMVTWGESDSLFERGYQNFWGNSPGAAAVRQRTLELLANQPGLNTYALLYKWSDGNSALAVENLITNLTDSAIIYNANYSGATQARESVRQIQILNPKVFLLVGGDDETLNLFSEIAEDEKFTPEIAIHASVLDYFAASLFDRANYWVTMVSFASSNSFGVSGHFLGTTSEWTTLFDAQFGDKARIARAAAGSNACSMWAMGVQTAAKSGGEEGAWANVTRFRSAMLNLHADNWTRENFYGKIQFESSGRNIGKEYDAVQFRGGNMITLRSFDDLVWPAQWAWREEDGDDEDSANVGLIVGVTVAGVVCFLVILVVIVAVVVALIHWRFQILLVPKHRRTQDVNL